MISCFFLSLVLASTVLFVGGYLAVWAYLKGPDLSEFDHPATRRVTSRTEASPEITKVHEILANLANQSGSVGSKGRISRIRERFDAGFGEQPRDAQSLGVEIRPSDASGVPAEWVMSTDCDPRRRLLYVHGGAFYVGSPKSHRPLTAALAKRTGCAVLSIDYRLMPENSRKACIEDCQAAYRFILEQGPDGETPLDVLFMAGDSAGGNLILMLLGWAKGQGLRPVDRAVALSPATDSRVAGPTYKENLATDVMLGPLFRPALRLPRTVLRFWTMIFNRIHPCNPLISPLLGDLAGLPPTLVQASESEMLLGDARRYVNKAQKSGSPAELQTWPGMVHVWQIFDGVLPEATEALDQITDFLR